MCSKCEKELEADKFYRRETGQLRAECKECFRTRQRAAWLIRKPKQADYVSTHREQYRRYDRARYQRHRHKRLAQGIVYNARPEVKARKNEYNLAYYKKNRLQCLENSRRWNAENAEHVSESSKAYRKMNRGIVRACLVRYTARLKALPEDFAAEDFEFCMTHWNNCCAVCGATADGRQLCLDHWIPLFDEKCPGTIPQNIIPLCRFCNSSKHVREATEWLLWKVGVRCAAQVLNAVRDYFASVRQGVCHRL